MPRDDPRRAIPLLRTGLAAVALVWLALVAALLWRSTETWIPVDPASAQRLLDLAHEQRSLAREWEGAQRGDARFELDTQIRYVAARIEDLERRARDPARIRGLAPWRALASGVGALAVSIAATLLATLAAVASALAVVLLLNRASPRLRLPVLAACLAPLGLPPPLLAGAIADLGAALGLAPSAPLAAVGAVVAGIAPALLTILAVSPRLPDAEIAAARELGLGRATIGRRCLLPALAPALTLATAVVFLRLLGDVSLGRIVGGDAAPSRFGEWLRHRIVATVDFPAASAGSLAAALVAVGLVAGLALVAIRLAPTRGRGPRPPSPLPAPIRAMPGDRLRTLAPAVVSLPILAALLVRGLSLGAASVAAEDRLVEAATEIARALLAGGVAMVAALALLAAVERARLGVSLRVVGFVALAVAALPWPVIGFALRLVGADLGAPIGPGLAVLAQALAATGPVLALMALAHPDRRLDDAAPPLHWTVGPVLPVAVVVAVTIALAAGDLGTIVGVVDRTLSLRPPPLGAADPAALLGLASAVLVGLVAARGLETARSRGLDP